MLSKREIAALILGRAITPRLRRASSAKSKTLRILAYHRVLDDDPRSFAFDEGVISAGTEIFYEQMKFARSNFDVLSFRDLRDCEIKGRPWPDRALIVTFDDGYRDNYTNAFPVLKQMGLPATIFLTTDHIGRAKLFWWDLIAYCIKRAQARALFLPEISAEPIQLDMPAQRERAIQTLLDWVKQVPDETRRSFINRLDAETEVALPASLAEGMHLSWEEVRRMADGGIEFGSHTATHPILANVAPAQLEQEISASKNIIEQNTGEQVIAFAYPVGGRSHFNDSVQQVVARCGFRYAVSYVDGVADEKSFDRYALPRIHVDSDHSLNLFRANLMFPQLMLRS